MKQNPHLSPLPSTTTEPAAHWQAARTHIDEHLKEYLSERTALAKKRNPAEARLWSLLADVTLTGGKRLRPYLVMWAYQAFGGHDQDSILNPAIAWELLHQGLLIHDDIIDRDYVRHAHPNVAGQLQKYYAKQDPHVDANHFALSGALLAGDLAYSGAYELLIRSDFEPQLLQQCSHVLTENFMTVIGGELLDTEAVLEPLHDTDSLLVAELKTASYSFVGPLQTGAILAGAPPTALPKLKKLGIALGIAFQLSDDLLGLFGDESQTGKPNDSDVHEGKRTLLIQYALQAASASDQNTVENTLGDASATPAAVERVRAIVVATGARKKVEQLIDEYLDQTQDIIERLPITDDSCKTYYEFLIGKLRRRVS